MPKKVGNAGHGLEEYSSKTGRYMVDGERNKYYDNPIENELLGAVPAWAVKKTTANKSKNEETPPINKLDFDFSKKHGINLIQGNHSIDDDASLVNPNYKPHSEYSENCTCCTVSYEMRRRGLDVEAAPVNKLRVLLLTFNLSWSELVDVQKAYDVAQQTAGYSKSILSWCYDNVPAFCPIFKKENGDIAEWTALGSSYTNTEKAVSKVYNDILSSGNGARFIIAMEWAESKQGHVINAEVKDGDIIFVDPQRNKIYSFDLMQETLFKKIKPSRLSYIRVDNKELNDDYYYSNKYEEKINMGELAYKPKK